MVNVQQEVVDWLTSQKGWQTELGYRLINQAILSDDDYREIITMLKSNIAYDGKAFPNIGHSVQNGSRIRLKSIRQISNIEGLSPRNPLEFDKDNQNLVVIYGDNGSGKSGYTRIIKKICGKQGARELLHNIFGAKTPLGSCTIKYLLDDSEKESNWTISNDPIEELKQVDIFDSDTARTYIQASQKTTYTPVIVSFFEALSVGYDEVKRRLAGMKNSLISSLPTIPANYISTPAGSLYKTLKARHSEADLVILFPWTEENDEQLKGLNERLSATDPAKVAEGKRKNKKELDAFILLVKGAAEATSYDAYTEIKRLKADVASKRKIADQAMQVLSGSAIDGVGSDSWKSLWNAAKEFSINEAYKGVGFPNVSEEARCVLCQQSLDADAIARFNSFNDYIEGKIEKDAALAEKHYADKIDSLPKAISKEEMETKCIAAGIDDWLTQIMDVRAAMVNNAKLIAEGADNIPDISKQVELQISALEAKSKQYEDDAVKFEEDAKAFDRTQASKNKIEFEAKKWCSEQKEAILAEVARLKKIEQYDKWISDISTNALTRKANEVSEKTVTEEYIRRFNEELRRLGAHNIKIELVSEGGKGTVKHSMVITGANGVRPHEILSEGEFRIVALAAFMADVTGGNNCNPFIFDDPISSLDQLFEERVIDRLVELSRERQVIVFTHRLSLLGLLSEKCKEAILLGIKKEHWGAGEIGDTPFFAKKPNKALTKLKDESVPKAKKVLETEGTDSYEKEAGDICKQIRIQVERIVELTLLADVIQRYRRAVNTVGKIHKLAAIEKEDCALIDKFMTKYSRYEHSQPGELPVQLPPPQELENDLSELLTWYDGFEKKKDAQPVA